MLGEQTRYRILKQRLEGGAAHRRLASRKPLPLPQSLSTSPSTLELHNNSRPELIGNNLFGFALNSGCQGKDADRFSSPLDAVASPVDCEPPREVPSSGKQSQVH